MALVQDDTLGSRQRPVTADEVDKQEGTFHGTPNKLPVAFFRLLPAASSKPLYSPATV